MPGCTRTAPFKLLGTAVLAVVAASTLARAQAPAPEVEPEPAPLSAPVEQGAAADFLAEGLRRYQAEEYLLAAESLERAYALDRQPLLLFNIAQALRKGGRPREALAMYERFLLAEPQTSLRGEAEGYRNDMKALLAEQERGEQARRALLREQERGQRQQRATTLERERAERVQAERERRRPLYRRGWFWGVLAASAVAVGAGVGLGVAFSPSARPTDGGFVEVVF